MFKVNNKRRAFLVFLLLTLNTFRTFSTVSIVGFEHVFVAGRSSRPELFCKKGVLRNFARPATLFKKSLWHRCFPVNFGKFLRTPFFIEHLWWLLLCWDKFLNYQIYEQDIRLLLSARGMSLSARGMSL